MRRRGIEIRECKTVDGLRKEALKKPHRYQESSPGCWVCQPGEVAAKVYGAEYRIWTPAQLTPAMTANLVFLGAESKTRPDLYQPPEYLAVVDYVRQHQGVTLAELCKAAGVEGPARVCWLILQGHLFCDLSRYRLAESDQALVYTDVDVAKAGEHFLANSKLWPAQRVGSSLTPVEQASSGLSSVSLEHSVSAFRCANRRLAILQGRDSAAAYSPRTIRGWKAMEARKGYVGLIPRTDRQGYSDPRFPAVVYQTADAVIKEVYMKTAGMKVAAAYRQFSCRCTETHIAPIPSQVWFWKRVGAIREGDRVAARNGPRAAYTYLAGPRGQVGLLGIHGDYPLQMVHIDHTQLDVEIRSATSPLNLGRPWLTIAFDAASRSVVGIYLTFDHPSIDCVMMVLRDLVLRYGHLPFGLTVDNGDGFRSTWFEVFTGLKNIIVRNRPPHYARFGCLIESFFGVANSQLIHNLEGNTQLTKNVRQLTKSIDPAGKAIWTLPALYQAIEEYCFQHFNQRPHPDLGQTPSEAFTSLMIQHGMARPQECDDAFLIDTMVSVGKGTARVQPGKGIKIKNDYFFNPVLADYIRRDVPVRFDPMDAGRVLCELDGKWVTCWSKYADRVAGLSVRQVQDWSTQLRQRHQATAHIRGASVARLGRFIDTIRTQTEGELRAQYERNLANREVLALKPRLLLKGAAPISADTLSGGSTGLAGQPAPVLPVGSVPPVILEAFPTTTRPRE